MKDMGGSHAQHAISIDEGELFWSSTWYTIHPRHEIHGISENVDAPPIIRTISQSAARLWFVSSVKYVRDKAKRKSIKLLRFSTTEIFTSDMKITIQTRLKDSI